MVSHVAECVIQSELSTKLYEDKNIVYNLLN